MTEQPNKPVESDRTADLKPLTDATMSVRLLIENLETHDTHEIATIIGDDKLEDECRAALAEVGERERADNLLNKALLAIGSTPRLGYGGFGISDVEIYALLGDKEKALDTFVTTVEAGWRSSWWINTEMNDNLASLHDDPRYRATIAGIQFEMAEQLARTHEWAANGDLAIFPKSMD